MTIAELIFATYPTHRPVRVKELIDTVSSYARSSQKPIVSQYTRKHGFKFVDGSILKLTRSVLGTQLTVS